ncbi:hypothetical protein O6H91_20G017600 [Diphasiastrum complanatum]|uniref:Uncharacterized protein n=1 Tax=Diphasiastrum complanatum TaxID=34168 RepID=A0ACC2ANB2_DIPCM|nr:hypothetical protein O6H91_20G017600 [Diphasiastrum complanatum]
MIWARSLYPCCGNFALRKPNDAGAMAVVFGLLLLLIVEQVAGTAAGGGILKLNHRYSGIEGSSLKSGGRGMSQQYFQRLLEHDQARHGRFLTSAVDFPLGGTFDPSVAGLYYTEVGLGTPSKQYVVQVDTGSDVLWVNCQPCVGCPTKSDLGVPLSFYDPHTSSSQSLQCSDPLCAVGKSVNEASCTSENTCAYSFEYGDGSTAEGYYIRDAFQYEQLDGSNSRSNATTEVVFGCSFNQSGQLSSSSQAVDGIMGFGQLDLSVPSQLAAQGKAPHKFAHCLNGEQSGGGILVIGDVVVADMQFTPLVPNASHYNVNLLGISVNSANLSIDPAEFASADSSGAIFDSGTTLAYLPQRAYDTFVRAIVESSTSQPVPYQQETCFIVTGRFVAEP